MNPFSQYIFALRSAPKFGEFLKGKQITLSDGRQIAVKVQTSRRSLLRPGLRFSKYSYITDACSNEGVQGTGYGEANFRIVAFEKSVAEAVERVIFRTLKTQGN